MNEKVIELAKEAGIIEGFNDVHPSIERFYELAVAEERKKYDALLTEYEAQANRAITNNDFKERLAQAIEQMPFGDTAASFAAFVREFK